MDPAVGSAGIRPLPDLADPSRAIAEVAAKAKGVLREAGPSVASLGGMKPLELGLGCGVDPSVPAEDALLSVLSRVA